MFGISKNHFPKKLFVITSLLSLIIVAIFFYFLKIEISSRFKNKYSGESEVINNINNEYITNDPFITRGPGFVPQLMGPVISKDDPSMGNIDSKVIIVYYSDFDCSFCRQQEEVLKKTINNFGNDIRFIWKDYPDKDISSDSYRAAVAGRCANEQGKFWEYHDLLFALDKYNENDASKFARDLSLNMALFEDCLNDKEIRENINSNIEEANALDINGVPFTFINNHEIMGGSEQGEIEEIINLELKNNGK